MEKKSKIFSLWLKNGTLFAIIEIQLTKTLTEGGWCPLNKKGGLNTEKDG